MAANLYSQIDANKRKTWLLLTGFFFLIMLIGYGVGWYFDNINFLYLALIVSLTMSIGSYWGSDKLVLSMSGAEELKQKDAPEVYRSLENLAITAGLPTPRLFLIDDGAPNAFATGRDPEHAVICVTSGLLAKLNKVEVEGVLAHELSHVGNHDILVMTLVTVLVGGVVLLAGWARNSLWFGGRRRDNNNNGGGLVMIVVIVLSILAPIAAYLMQFAISRKREFLADAAGVMLTRYPEGLASALRKIAADHQPLAAANRATAHLYIESPFKEDEAEEVSWWQKAFMTHPPIAERIRALTGGND